jgi:hypothetical protein
MAVVGIFHQLYELSVFIAPLEVLLGFGGSRSEIHISRSGVHGAQAFGRKMEVNLFFGI